MFDLSWCFFTFCNFETSRTIVLACIPASSCLICFSTTHISTIFSLLKHITTIWKSKVSENGNSNKKYFGFTLVVRNHKHGKFSFMSSRKLTASRRWNGGSSTIKLSFHLLEPKYEKSHQNFTSVQILPRPSLFHLHLVYSALPQQHYSRWLYLACKSKFCSARLAHTDMRSAFAR